MADAADFVIRLIDRATGPAKRIAASFANIDKAMKPVTGNKAFKAIDAAGTKLWDFGKTAALVGGVVAVGLGGALTKASLDAAMFGENTRLAFTRLTGSAALGKEAFETVTRNVEELGLDLHQATDGFRKLIAAQFTLKQSEELLRMSADLSAIGIHGEEAGRVLMAITQIKAKGKLQAEEMLQLAEAGISLDLVNKELQKSLGKNITELDKMKQAGKITGEVGIDAIMSAVKQKLHITEFGQARKDFVGSNLSGMIEALKAQSQLLFLKLGDSISSAADALKPLVQDTAEWLKNLDTSTITDVVTSVLTTMRALIPVAREFLTGFIQGFGALSDGFRLDIDASSIRAAGEAGRQFAEALGLLLSVGKMVGSMFLWLTGTTMGKVVLGFGAIVILGVKVAAAVAAVAAAGVALTPVFAAMGTALVWVETIVAGLIFVFGAVPLAIAAAVAAALALIYVFRDEIDAALGGIPGRMFEVGKSIVMGLVNGVTSMLGVAWDAVKSVGSTVIDAAKSTLGIASPSKEFEKLGAWTSEGFAIGLEASAPRIESASARALASPAMSGADAGGLAGGGAPISVSVQVSVDGSKDPGATAQAVGDALETRLAMFFEGLINPSPAEAA